ncbi:MAG: rhodanese-like domain-containing protein [Cruoricaptor ignavus]|nr:rhodanese-like domain-containing protein [Cruoricaptor ignavus]
MKILIKILSISVLLALFSCKTAAISQSREKDLSTLIRKEKTILVDVRVPEQFAESPVKNAINIPLAELGQHLDFLKKQENIVLFCNTGNQSGQAFDFLKEHKLKNIHNAKTFKNILQMQNNIYNNLVFSKEKPSVYKIKKTEKTEQFAVGLAKETLLKKHITPVPTTLIVLKGEIVFNINDTSLHFKEGDVYNIPVNEEHEVIGKEAENVFIITKEL